MKINPRAEIHRARVLENRDRGRTSRSSGYSRAHDSRVMAEARRMCGRVLQGVRRRADLLHQEKEEEKVAGKGEIAEEHHFFGRTVYSLSRRTSIQEYSIQMSSYQE